MEHRERNNDGIKTILILILLGILGYMLLTSGDVKVVVGEKGDGDTAVFAGASNSLVIPATAVPVAPIVAPIPDTPFDSQTAVSVYAADPDFVQGCMDVAATFGAEAQTPEWTAVIAAMGSGR